MTNLTPEQVADGWKPIADIVNEPDDGIFQILEPRLHGAFYAPNHIFYKSDIKHEFGNTYSTLLFRRLIPQTPDMVVISREDAELLIIQEWKSIAEYNACMDAINKLRTQLGEG